MSKIKKKERLKKMFISFDQLLTKLNTNANHFGRAQFVLIGFKSFWILYNEPYKQLMTTISIIVRKEQGFENADINFAMIVCSGKSLLKYACHPHFPLID